MIPASEAIVIVHAELFTHPKLLRAVELFERAGHRNAYQRVLAFHLAGINHAREQLTNGRVTPVVCASFVRETRSVEMTNALVKAGLWDRDPKHGYRIHDFHPINPKAETVKALRESARLRKAQQRARKKANGGDGVPG